MSVINSYNLYFNTKYRSSGTPDYCTFNLLTPLILTPNYDSYFRVALTNLEIPFAWTSLRNATLTFNFNALSTQSLTIPNGNYNITQLLTQISTQLVASLAALGVVRTFNFTFDSTFQKATLDFGTTASNNDTMTLLLSTGSTMQFITDVRIYK